MRKLLSFGYFLLAVSGLFAQELVCTVNVDASQVGGDKQVIQNMKDAITRVMNQNKWTSDQFAPEERIKCYISIAIMERNDNNFKASANIRVVRPVYNSSYETQTLNLSDKSFDFTYAPFQEIRYTEGTYVDNITALLGYYAYIIIGSDYDCFAQGSGTPFYQKAQDILNLASGAPEPGWTIRNSPNPTQNRFVLVENLLNGGYSRYHSAMYKYHREGLDGMEKDITKGRKKIIEALKDLQQLNSTYPGLRIVRAFLDAKNVELITIFTKAPSPDKTQFLELMQSIDPLKMDKYNEILR